jgi:predicted ABC-type transport system involved in lysophospholipase L1 biosynthesis ATPase subunit
MGKTVLMVTHDVDLARRSGRQIHISDGILAEDSSGVGK